MLDERKMRYSRERVVQIINVCTALHNVCVENTIHLDEEIDVQENLVDNHLQQNEISSIASNIRDELKQLFL